LTTDYSSVNVELIFERWGLSLRNLNKFAVISLNQLSGTQLKHN